MRLTREEVQHIAALARMSLSDDEIERMRVQLSHILENFEALNQLDTTNVPATTYSVPLQNVLRDDSVRPSLPKEDILANAPQQQDGCFKVRAVLEEP